VGCETGARGFGARSEGGHGGPPVRATGDSILRAPVGDFTSSPGWGAAPPPTGGGPTRIRYVGVGAACGRRPVFSYRPRSLTLAPVSALRLPRAASARLASDSPLATWPSGDLLLCPSAPSMRCPGAVTPPRRLARGSVRPRPASSLRSGSCAGVTGSLAMPRSEDRLGARLPSFRRAASADHLPPPQRRGRAGTLSVGRGEKMGSLGEGRREGRRRSLVVRWAPRTGRWMSSFPSHISGMPARLTRRCSRSEPASGQHEGALDRLQTGGAPVPGRALVGRIVDASVRGAERGEGAIRTARPGSRCRCCPRTTREARRGNARRCRR